MAWTCWYDDGRRVVASRLTLRTVALVYLAGLLVVPVALVAYRTFAHGAAPVWGALSSPPARHADGSPAR